MDEIQNLRFESIQDHILHLLETKFCLSVEITDTAFCACYYNFANSRCCPSLTRRAAAFLAFRKLFYGSTANRAQLRTAAFLGLYFKKLCSKTTVSSFLEFNLESAAFYNSCYPYSAHSLPASDSFRSAQIR